MLEIEGNLLENYSFLGDLKPDEVLYYFDGPRIFTSKDIDNKLVFVYQCDESDQRMRFVAVPFSETLLTHLKAGSITLLEALDQPRVWVIDQTLDGKIKSVWLTDLVKIDKDRLPKQNAMLWPELQPKFALRVIHEEARLGHVPSNIIQGTIDRVKKSFRILTDHIAPLADESSNIIKELLNPPAQRFAYKSFEVAFQMPSPKNQAETFFMERFESCLKIGFSAIHSGTNDDFSTRLSDIGESDRLAILSAMKELAPSSHSQIKEIEVSGSLVSKFGTVNTLTPEIYKSLRKCVLTLEGDTCMVRAVGKIKQCDRDKFLFDLRDINTESSEGVFGSSLRCQFESSQEDEVLPAFNEGYEVTVSGIIKKNTNVLEVDRVMKRGAL